MSLCCEQIERLLGRYADKELSPAELSEVDSHIEFCSSCRAEFEARCELVGDIATAEPVSVPSSLWGRIEAQLDQSRETSQRSMRRSRMRRTAWAMAASVVLIAGLGLFDMPSSKTTAQAATVDFSVLLNALPLNAHAAFRKFLARYDGKETTPIAAKRNNPTLNFDTPAILPGGFRLKSIYELRIAGTRGIAAAYDRDGEFLAAVFHAPMKHERFGSHEKFPCVIGKHCGYKVQVGEWKLIHMTDSTTCHCLLSRLDEETGIPLVMAAIAPKISNADAPNGHQHP